MLKLVVLGVASLAFVGTAVAADLPRPQPQPVAAPDLEGLVIFVTASSTGAHINSCHAARRL